MSSSSLRGAWGLVCAASIGLAAVIMLDRRLRTSTAERDGRLLQLALCALDRVLPEAGRLTVTAHDGRVLVSGPAPYGHEARIMGCLRDIGVHAMQLSVTEVPA